jgi:membrane protease YdiL (CAAX protease family)
MKSTAIEETYPEDVAQHTLWQSLFFHLFPGILIGIAYFLLRQPIDKLGYPSLMALMISIIFVLIPFELGVLFFQGKKRNGKWSLDGIVLYRKAIPFWQVLVWVPCLFIISGLVFTFLKPIDQFLYSSLFSWMPQLNSGLDGTYSRQVLIVTYSFMLVFVVVIGPWVEELYFRGFLLPRMNYLKKWSPLVHSLLFAIYHTFTPWMFVTRTVAMLPLIYAVRQKNINLGIITHILLNSIDVFVGVSFILNMV